MRIVHVLDYFQPKIGYQETFLAREHARAGHEVYVVTSDRYNPDIYAGDAAKNILGDRMVGAGFFNEEGIMVWRLKLLFEFPRAIWLSGLERKILELRPDVIIVHGIAHLTAIRIARFRLKKKLPDLKLIYDDHMTATKSQSKMVILYPLFRRLFSPLIQKEADALVAIVPETREFMYRKYGIPPRRVSIIPLGADDGLFRFDADARKEMRDSLNISENETVFIYVGRIVPYKRLEWLIEAATRLTSEHKNVRVMLVGGGSKSYIDELKQKIKLEELEKRFIWHEAVPNEQLCRIYSAADVAAWPYGASISMREAMACSLPIIIGEMSTETELVEYNNGFTYREGDLQDLTQKMEKLLDAELRREMSRNSRKLIEEKYNWKTIARQFIELVTESQA